MKNSFKLILLIVLITTISCNQNKSNNSIPKQDYSETEKLIKEICSKQESYYFNLFKGIKYSFRRGYYIINFNNGHQVCLRKINNQYLYSIYGDIDSQDTVLYDLNIHSKEFEDKYEWDVDRAKKFIDFCYGFKLMQLFVREEQQRISIITLYCQIIYTKKQPSFDYKRKLCSDWYLTDEKKFNEDWGNASEER
ncbi:MAG: hypothetical protein H6Q15_697 [Bacteroidetes bacterium]|nr:hypothetical protein [Bacteroidota bacterium]